MQQNASLGRIIIIVGFLSVFGLSYFTWGGVSAPNSVQTLTFPTFSNPFDQPGVGINVGLGSPWPAPDFRSTTFETAHGTDNGCSQNNFWLCLTDPNGPDDASTYVTNGQVVIGITGWPSSGKVRDATLTLACRTPSGNAVLMGAILISPLGESGSATGVGYLASAGQGTYCKVGSVFQTTTFHMTQDAGAPLTDLNQNPVPPNLQLVIFGAGADISTVSMSATVLNPNACTGNDFFSNLGCNLQAFGQTLLFAGQFVINVILYIFAWVVTIGAFLSSIAGILAYFFAIPGTPVMVQAAIDVLLVSLLFILIMTMASLVRGVGT